jgi:hypothetical protein
MDALQEIQTRFENKVENILQGRFKSWKVAFIAAVISVMGIFGNIVPLNHYKQYFESLKAHQEYYAYQTVVDRAKDMIGNHTYKPDTGLNNRTFRITTPVFVKIFHLYPATFWLYFIQLILGLVFFKLLFQFFFKTFDNQMAAFYAVIAIATTYTGMSFWMDFSGFEDFYSYFFLFMAIYYRQPLLVFVFTQCAFWNDERAFVAGGFVFLWWWFAPQWQTKKPIDWTPNAQMLVVVFSWAFYWLIRYFVLTKMYGVHDTYDSTEFAEHLPQNLKVWGFKMGWGLEALWLVVVLAFGAMLWQKDYIRLLLLAACLLVNLTLSMTIYDTTRSSAFSYMIVFPCLVFLSQSTEKERLKNILLLVALLCFLHPLATKTSAIGFFLM